MEAELVLDLTAKMALIVAAGIGAQWLGWRLQWPAIVLLSLAGLILGPFSGAVLGTPLIDPAHDFGELLRPAIGLAVALILFEGGLGLRFADLRDAGSAVRRLVFIGAPLGWAVNTAAAYYLAGLSLPLAALFGGLMVVTGPTVILPLLRQARLSGRPAAVLKWEGIVNDPVGALFAVAVYEIMTLSGEGDRLIEAATGLLIASAIASIMGVVAGFAMVFGFRRGWVPEFLKSPLILAVVLLVFAGADALANETGLVAVTALGLTMANIRFAAIDEMRRFKESIATLLVSSLFIILTAGLDVADIGLLDLRTVGFVAAMLFVVRPFIVFVSTLGTKLEFREKLLIGWIAPRGIVAVAVAGFFATELGGEAKILAPLTFAMVFATVLAHGFTIGPLAKALGLSKTGPEGLLLVGASAWSRDLAKALGEMQIPVVLADANWQRLSASRLDGTPVFHGEVLSELAEYKLDHARIDWLFCASDNDAYNALVCVEYAPELGRHRVIQLSGQSEETERPDSIAFTARGRTAMRRGRSFESLRTDHAAGWRFRRTELSEAYTLDDLKASMDEGADLVLEKRSNGSLHILGPGREAKGGPGTIVLSFGPPVVKEKPIEKSDI
ncbi:Na(+)/H(+) antiporter [hydrothermal vent metagenome]|uniref:Na(+)/H(+) antiporter n=1 Tax=hydrothermal vent metagenome TaxID=652676 RepID=A0A3B0R4P0_9ZZZZ